MFRFCETKMAFQTGAITPYSETPLFLDYIYILAENADFVNHIIQQIAAYIHCVSVHIAQNVTKFLNFDALFNFRNIRFTPFRSILSSDFARLQMQHCKMSVDVF